MATFTVLTTANDVPLTTGLAFGDNDRAVARAAGVDLVAYAGRPSTDLQRALVPAVHRIAADPTHFERYRPQEHGTKVGTTVTLLQGLVALLRLHPGTVSLR